MSNYIVDTNPYNLAGPPAYWLRQLHEFDPSLVVVPSRQGFFYRLAQRRKLNLPEHMVNDLLFQQSDTQMLATYGLVPVTTIIATARWDNPLVWKDLAERAPWRQGGFEKYMEKVVAVDNQREAAKQAKTTENLQGLSNDAWNLYLKRIGLRSHMYSPKTSNRSRIPNANQALLISGKGDTITPNQTIARPDRD